MDTILSLTLFSRRRRRLLLQLAVALCSAVAQSPFLASGQVGGLEEEGDLHGSTFTRPEDPSHGSTQERDEAMVDGSLSARSQEKRQYLRALRCAELVNRGLPLTELQKKRCLAALRDATVETSDAVTE